MDKIKISCSQETAKNKENARYLTEFIVEEIDLNNQDELKNIFTNHNYSFNIWTGNEHGHCSKSNYRGMCGVILDIDEGVTLSEAREKFSGYKYIIHTSTSHQIPKNENPACDRYRVILPFETQNQPYFINPSEADTIYKKIESLFPYADPVPLTRAGKFYPYFGTPDRFYMEVNTDGEWFMLPEVEANSEVIELSETTQVTIPERKTKEKYITYNMQIIMADRKTKHTLETLKEALIEAENNKLPCYCPFCNDLKSRNPSATVQITWDGFVRMYCSHCHSIDRPDFRNQYVFYEDPIEPGMFTLEDMLMRIQKNKNNSFVVKVSWEYLREQDRKMARTYLSRMRNIPKADFKVEKYASAEYEKVDYELDIKGGLLKVYIPSAINLKIEDNKYIDNWLEGLFGDYSDFIKDWLALYCYTNYKPLPVIVMTGPRAAGKTTFAEIVGEVFPDLTSDWGGEATNFTPFFTKKLLIIEENYINKKSQYVQLKGITGAAYLTVNEKFIPHYKVRNNIKIILTTNEKRPLFLVSDERPINPDQNNFFIHKVPPVVNINPRIKEEILDRLGHYIYTELKERYERWLQELPTNSARYGIPCPITPLAEDLYVSAKTGIEAEAEMLAEAIVCGIGVNEIGRFGISKVRVGGEQYIKKQEFTRICKQMGFRAAKSINDYWMKLQDMGVLAYQETRDKNQRYGYEILKTKDYYGKETEEGF